MKDPWKEGREGGRMGRKVEGRTDGWMDGQTDQRPEGWRDGWTGTKACGALAVHWQCALHTPWQSRVMRSDFFLAPWAAK